MSSKTLTYSIFVCSSLRKFVREKIHLLVNHWIPRATTKQMIWNQTILEKFCENVKCLNPKLQRNEIQLNQIQVKRSNESTIYNGGRGPWEEFREFRYRNNKNMITILVSMRETTNPVKSCGQSFTNCMKFVSTSTLSEAVFLLLRSGSHFFWVNQLQQNQVKRSRKMYSNKHQKTSNKLRMILALLLNGIRIFVAFTVNKKNWYEFWKTNFREHYWIKNKREQVQIVNFVLVMMGWRVPGSCFMENDIALSSVVAVFSK